MRAEAWPDPANAEELHDALLWLGCLNAEEVQAVPEWPAGSAALAGDNRVIRRSRRRRRCGSRPNGRSSSSRCTADSRSADRKSCAAGWKGWGRSRRPRWPHRSAWSRTRSPPRWSRWRSKGFALRGRFTPGSNAEEWCDRRLLARIHHYTVRRLRAEIEPVAARDFLRFLFAWQRVTDETRLEGPDSVPAAVALLEGFEAPAGAWETEILPARITGYEPAWLDDSAWRDASPGRG